MVTRSLTQQKEGADMSDYGLAELLATRGVSRESLTQWHRADESFRHGAEYGSTLKSLGT